MKGDDFGDDADAAYPLEEADRVMAFTAMKLIAKVLASTLPTTEQRVVIKGIAERVAALPHEFPSIDALMRLTGPWRRFGDHKVYHWWTVEIEGERLALSSSGYIDRDATGGDSFLSMSWSIEPECEAQMVSRLRDLWMVGDAAPIEVEVDRIDLARPGYSLEVYCDGEELHPDDLGEDGHETGEASSSTIDVPSEATTDLSVAEGILAEVDAASSQSVPEVYFSGPPAGCDSCSRRLSAARYMVDGVRRDGTWGCLCGTCFFREGGGLGSGMGQLYRQTQGRWRLVAGY